MFKLQRLEITGFKSFADYTEIVFTGSGITAIVGPNGCGKSNFSDAISWVLGEQRAKSLRGEEMKDVVFQGTGRRKPSGMAEVVLHLIRDEEFEFADDEENLTDIDEALNELDENTVDFDEIREQQSTISGRQPADTNNGGGGNGFHPEETEIVETAPIGSIHAAKPKNKTKKHWRARSVALDFAPGEAVSVTRRLYLSGESEYLLNGRACRLRDIQDLFAGTGLSGAHYALIEQGKIGQILSSKPADRRNLIEEAAGISKFRTRQRAAETRLDAAKSNLRRISDIVSEIDKQANSLRRQAAKTRRYKIMREEFRALLRQLFTAEGKYLTELGKELDARLEKAVQGEREIFERVGAKEESFREMTGAARQAEESLSAIRARHSENALRRDRTEREFRYQKEQIENLEKRSAVLKSETGATEQRLKLTKSEIERLKTDERRERAEAERNEIVLRTAENTYRAEANRLREIEVELESERSGVLQHATAAERLSGIERQLENTIERLKERAEGLRREGKRAEESYTEQRNETENLARNLSVEREKLAKLQNEKKEFLTIEGKARAALKETEKTLNISREKFSRTKHRLETLRELEEKRAIYAPTIQKIFSEEKRIGVKFLGTLADKLTVDERAERAVENLFGTFLETILVETEPEAEKVAQFLRANNAGRVAILAIGNRRSAVGGRHRKIEGVKNSQIRNLIGASPDFALLLEAVFPREMSAQAVEKLEDTADEGDAMFVTFDGDLKIGARLFVAGKIKSNEKNNSLLAFKRELRELESNFTIISAEVETAKNETETARFFLTGQENKIADLQARTVKIERETISLEIREKSLRQETERAERHKRVVGEETKQIEKEIGELAAKQKEAKINAQKAERAKNSASEKLSAISEKLSEIKTKTEVENSALNEQRTVAATSSERRRAAQSALKRIETEQTELESRLANQNLEILDTDGKLQKLIASIAEIKRKTALAESEQEGERNELEAAAAHLKLARQQADQTSLELAELNKQAAEARNERAALEIRQTEAITKLQNLNENCAQELNLSLVELVENAEIETDFNLTETRKTVENLREKLENFGAINMLALEELAEAEERLLFLTTQRKDIIDGITSAEEALREIKERSREKFKQAFYAINRNFTEFFSELFGGGRGEMTLLESEDVLEAGIEIVAQPPGKRLQNILLLSGGEKAMTAIALVMAIFRFRPAPFCLLDEVDAPLDDANVGRFVDKIADMSEKTQFIVITHNKRTMEAARALYGVTMQEAGVSKVVSVRFE